MLLVLRFLRLDFFLHIYCFVRTTANYEFHSQYICVEYFILEHICGERVVSMLCHSSNHRVACGSSPEI